MSDIPSAVEVILRQYRRLVNPTAMEYSTMRLTAMEAYNAGASVKLVHASGEPIRLEISAAAKPTRKPRTAKQPE